MKAQAIVFQQPQQLSLQTLSLPEVCPGQIEVEVEYSGISTGTERLLWDGSMPPFPGMGYPLVPGYETVGRVTRAGDNTSTRPGQRVFVPGAQCFEGVRSLFGGAASKLVVPESRTVAIQESLGEQAVLLALAATAYHSRGRWRTTRTHPGARVDRWSWCHGSSARQVDGGRWRARAHRLGDRRCIGSQAARATP